MTYGIVGREAERQQIGGVALPKLFLPDGLFGKLLQHFISEGS